MHRGGNFSKTILTAPTPEPTPRLMSLTAWTQNAWGEADDLKERLVCLLKGVNSKQPGILFSQELFTPHSRHFFDTLLGDKYFLFHAIHKVPRPPLISFFLPVLCYLVVGPLAMRDARCAWGLVANPFTILVIVNLLFPLLFPVRPWYTIEGCWGVSFMASCTCFSKDKFSDAQVLEETWFPHSIRGYPVPPLSSPGKLIFYYLQHTFFRPHFTVSVGSLREVRGGEKRTRRSAANTHNTFLTSRAPPPLQLTSLVAGGAASARRELPPRRRQPEPMQGEAGEQCVCGVLCERKTREESPPLAKRI